MKYENCYFFNGTAYAGKSTLVKRLAEKYDGIACEENYHNALLDKLDKDEFPNLCYTRDLKDWADFIRRTPEEYAAWIDGASKESARVEHMILKGLAGKTDKKIFVDTNISPEELREVSDEDHVLIMLADPGISVSRFFDRPDREKQFLYRLCLAEPDPQRALDNFRECIARINTPERYAAFENAGFKVIKRDENRSIEETVRLAESLLKL